MPSQRDMAEERDASPARRARRDARRRARPSGHFYVADRDEDYATPRLDDDGDGTGDDALGVASKRTTSSPHLSAIRTDARVIRTVAVRVVVRAPARAPPRSEARRPADRERERRAPTDADARGGDDSPGTREASLRTRERRLPGGGARRRFLPRRGRARLPLRLARRRFPEDAPASSHPRSLSASDAAARATEEARLENLKSRGRMTASEVTAHYRRARVRALRAAARRGGPGRVRHPIAERVERRSTGSRRLTRPGGRRGAAEREDGFRRDCGGGGARRSVLVIAHDTEGSLAPTAAPAAPPVETLCRACVTWRGTRAKISPIRHTCGAAIASRGARGRRRGRRALGSGAARRIAGLKILCRNALTCAKNAADGSLTWRMDKAGCPDIARLAARVDGVSLRVRRRRVRFTRRRQPGGSSCARRCRRRDIVTTERTREHRLVSCAHPGFVRATDPKPVRRGARLLCERRPFACPNRPRCAVDGDEPPTRMRISRECESETVPRPGGPGGGSEGREGHVRRQPRRRDESRGAQGRVSVPRGSRAAWRARAAAAGRARVEVRGENRRAFQMARATGRGPRCERTTRACARPRRTVRVRGVRVRAQGATGGVPSALEGVLPRTPAPRPR